VDSVVTTATTTSSRAQVQIIDPAVTAMDIELVDATVTGWDATAGGLVFEKEGGWGDYEATAAAIPIKTLKGDGISGAWDADKYARIEFSFIGYKADGTAITTTGNQYSLDMCPQIYKGTETASTVDWNNNASAAATFVGNLCTTRWNLPGTKGSTAVQNAALTFSDGSWKVVIHAKNATNTGANKITKMVITSVKLIAR